jgi:hypothetical protein
MFATAEKPEAKSDENNQHTPRPLKKLAEACTARARGALDLHLAMLPLSGQDLNQTSGTGDAEASSPSVLIQKAESACSKAGGLLRQTTMSSSIVTVAEAAQNVRVLERKVSGRQASRPNN